MHGGLGAKSQWPNLLEVYDDGFIASGGLLTINSGTGSGVAQATSTAANPGLVDLQAGTTTTGYASKSLGDSTTPGVILPGTGRIYFGARVTIPVLSNGTDRFTCLVGLVDAATGAPANGHYFTYIDNANSGKWLINTNLASTNVTKDTAVTPVAAAFNFLEIEINEANTRADYYVDGVLITSVTAALPVLSLSPTLTILKSAGTSSKSFRYDEIRFRCQTKQVNLRR